jgi:hypothetical protein
MQELLIGVLLIFGVAWAVVRIRQKSADANAPPSKSNNNGDFHAVAIKYSGNACDAAKAMTDRRFLSNAAPRLPLPECNNPDCRCMFAHHKDRRDDEYRRSPFASAAGSRSIGSIENERREKAKRRDGDDGELL